MSTQLNCGEQEKTVAMQGFLDLRDGGAVGRVERGLTQKDNVGCTGTK